jgi:C-terminal peptidase prc
MLKTRIRSSGGMTESGVGRPKVKGNMKVKGSQAMKFLKSFSAIAFISWMAWSLCACASHKKQSPTLPLEASATPTSVATQVKPSPTTVPSLLPTQTISKNEYLQVFEEVWSTINVTYFDPDFGGLDWKEVHDRYEPQIAAVKDDQAFYFLINKMLFELNVSHIAFIPPEEKEQLEPVLSAEGSIGIDLRLLDGETVITSVQPGSPGEQAGLHPGLVIQRINGKTVEQWASEVWRIPPLHERNERKRLTSKLQAQVYGPLDTAVDLVYLDAHGETHEVTIQRAQRDGRVVLGDEFPPFYVEFESRRLDEEIGYIRFNAFVPPIDQRFPVALESLRDTRGLIIDLRGNSGGVFPVRKGLAEQLVKERTLFWSYKGRDSIQEVYLDPVPNAYSGPLVVLIDVMSASSAEEFSGALQAIGRAVVVGERSAGICVTADVLQLSNGAVLMYPNAQTRTADGTVLEGRGVIPDITVTLERSQLLEGSDAQLQAAIHYIVETVR